MARTFYWIVMTNPPSRVDFLSDRARGKRRPADPTKVDLYEGLSVYATMAQAQRKAHDVPFLGWYIAELRVADEAPIRVARSIKSSRGHHTMCGEPEAILQTVINVTGVDGERDG